MDQKAAAEMMDLAIKEVAILAYMEGRRDGIAEGTPDATAAVIKERLSGIIVGVLARAVQELTP